MSLADQLDSLFDAGFDQLYPIYGAEINIVEYGSGIPSLLIPGSAAPIESGIEALLFPLSIQEKEIYGTGYGEDSKKFVFKTETELHTSYLLQVDEDLYEIFKMLDRKAVGCYRIIGKKSEDV